MIRKSIFFIILFTACLRITHAQTGFVNDLDTLLEWKKGYLDIHHFHTGRGNSAFFILPDGTTMMIDAGEMGGSFGTGQTLHISPAYPDESRTAAGWISSYVKQLIPKGKKPKIDYALITHFHADHYGSITAASKTSAKGEYKLSGITAIAEEIPVGYLIDRNYPLYNFPVDLRKYYKADATFLNYLAFVDYQRRHNHILVDSLHTGATDQIRLLNQPDLYPSFQILGIKSGPMLWDSKKGRNIQLLHADKLLEKGSFNENPLSLAIKLSYGDFDYFTGGDNTGLSNYETPEWFDVETPMGETVDKVDVTTFNHHGNRDAMNENFLKKLSPRVLVQQSWCSDHPGQELAYRLGSEKLYAGPRDVFATYIHPETKITYGSWFVNAYASTEGHVMIRVYPGGREYIVVILQTIGGVLTPKKVYGPYRS
ncbi:hypothetical protein AQ505_09510 [Pedobacter sp. PACM 27299]|uniref:MBL fold metallo-hydrolase n=1 Tax=Pedobacter sp. PACM 27299 TaxID=1727164 RepID=UPI000706DC48|nr:MBL fold metallo-hydrolase [Pedobacter sp. PACM 27299]ALL05707.1 hypothetical protein AQ505_09510 [Pedobacter sp. PACM 27299]